MRRTRFVASQAGREWRIPKDLTELAKVCEGSRLTPDQAEVVRLAAMPYTYAEIAAYLSMSYTRARDVALRAERRIRANQSWVYDALTREIVGTLASFRNTFDPNPRAAVFRKIAGGYDTDPVRFRSRLTGECPEDFIEEPGRLLRTLPILLKDRSAGRST